MSLDESLERMARWEALRRRMAGPGRGEPVVEELIEAIGAVLHRYTEVSVTLAVEGTPEPATLRLHLRDGRVVVEAVAEPVPGHGEPEPESAPETPEQTAARLAALIRQDPSVLRRGGVTD